MRWTAELLAFISGIEQDVIEERLLEEHVIAEHFIEEQRKVVIIDLLCTHRTEL